MAPTIAHTIRLPRALPPVLAVGAFLKNTVCVTQGDLAHLSAVHGDLGTPEAIAAFESSVQFLLERLGVTPTRVAHDLHPDFHSTRFALSLDLPAVAVQHHHAHAAAIAAEHGHDGPVLGLSLDGFGLGPDNGAWGGELLWCEGPRFTRLGHLALLAQPGGDKAAREPWRMAAAALHRLGRGAEIATRWPHLPAAALLATVLERGVNCPATSSAGRLFDAACGLLGIHPVAEFEGQAPMTLESLVRSPRVLEGGWSIEAGILDCLPLLDTLSRCDDAVLGAELFHGTLIAALGEWCRRAAAETHCRTVALGGGCFLTRVLRQGLAAELARHGLAALAAVSLSPGDGGLSLGQAFVAGQAEV